MYLFTLLCRRTVKTVQNGHSQKRPQIGFQDQLSLNAGQKYCRMLPLENSAILLTFIKLPFVIMLTYSTDGQKKGQTSPKQNVPSTSFKVGGIKKVVIKPRSYRACDLGATSQQLILFATIATIFPLLVWSLTSLRSVAAWSEVKVTETVKWYVTRCHSKMHPHTKFGFFTSKNIEDSKN